MPTTEAPATKAPIREELAHQVAGLTPALRDNAPQPSQSGTVPWPQEYVARYIAKGYWEGRSIGEHILAAADAAPDVVAIVDGELRLTYRELAERADAAASRLRAIGLRGDDRMVVQLPNGWEFVVLILACLRLGVIPVMALPAHRRHELSYLVAQSQARAIAVPDTIKGFDYQAMASDIAAAADSVAHVLVSGTDIQSGSVDLRALCAPTEDPAAVRSELDGRPPASRSVAIFLLSGGTTGMPKLIARTHDDYAYGAKQCARVSRFGPGTVYLAVLPMGHNFTLGGPGIIGTLMSGGRVVIASSPAPGKAFTTIERERVTAAAVVPAVAQRWMEFRESDQRHDISSLEILQVGGAKLADYLASRIGPALRCIVQQGYGMAEGLICITRGDDSDEVLHHTQGRPICPDDELLVVDDQGQPVPLDVPGVLLTRGPYTPRGYYRAEEHNARSFMPDGWYRTGDIVRLRPDGNLVVEGRDKDMINCGGEKVSAEEVENLAYQVEGAARVAAVAMPDPVLGEGVCLYVVPHQGMTVELDDFLTTMDRIGVARFKMPKRVVLVGSLPVTNIGKIDKNALRKDIQRRLAAEQEDRAGSPDDVQVPGPAKRTAR